MCGIAGFVVAGALEGRSAPSAIAERMAEQLHHRGPDDQGVWCDTAAGVALAHRRLSILDLSAAGHQPMVSACGRYVLVFNGEIYNHLDIRQALGPNLSWRGHSDTETLLAAIVKWGLERALNAVVGMFALALWDRKHGSLQLARDRIGEKPLYYGWQGGVFMFASELKALRAHPSFRGEVDRQALSQFLRYSAIPAPLSIYREIAKLPPGTLLTLSAQDIAAKARVQPTAYWSFYEAALNSCPFGGDENEALDEIERLLRRSIAGQMVADVPLGAFLSGGIDSSLVVALMQAQSSRAVQTFTIGFHEAGYNEAQHAKAVATHLGTAHTELYVTAKEALDVIPLLPRLYDEPFADVSQIPTFLVSQLARQHVTVSLSGDGGDELFGGYNRHVWAASLWRRIRRIPLGGRRALAHSMLAGTPAFWDGLLSGASHVLPSAWRVSAAGEKVQKLANMVGAASPEEVYGSLVSHWGRTENIVIGDHFKPELEGLPTSFQLEHCMMYLDSVGYLPDDVLTKVDRAAMGVSLETRIPFLDHRLVEFAWQLPLSMKIRNGQGKWLLRQLLAKYIPSELTNRPKMGFSVPVDAWLRGPLRDWAEALIDEDRLRNEGYFNPRPIRDTWQAHLDGKRNCGAKLWSVLMFQAWLDCGE